MTVHRNTIILLILILFACKEKNEKQETDVVSTVVSISSTELKIEAIPNTASLKSVALFAKAVLKENIRIQVFDTTNLESIAYLDVFNSENLENIIAYSNKNYPKNVEPNHYEHFTLFVASYIDEVAAQKVYNQILKESTYGFSNLDELSDVLVERVKSLSIVAKAGGIITKKGRYIFSLVETCREAPMGKDWMDYENMFLGYIRESGKHMEILNANCGMDRFLIEKRKE